MEIDRDATCVIAGGGPAGLFCGFLLARAGLRTTVIEKHGDFLRDFRGDTIHPSTLQVMDELGLLDEFLRLEHQDIRYAEGDIGERRVRIADFTHLPVRHKRLVFMPQWDFLDFIAGKARRLANFRLLMNTQALAPIRENGRTVGLRVMDADGARREIRAGALVIAADGRDSRLREQAGLRVTELGAPMDVMWFRLDHRADEDHAVLGRIERGQALVMLYRGDYWQCALIIRKGTADAVRRDGLDAFRARVARLAGRDDAAELTGWDDVKLLTVSVDRLRDWHASGLLCIGDAAHAMSPIGGVGINLAIQDAVAAANILHAPLRRGRVETGDLARVQRRRAFPTWATQKLQTTIQDRVIDPILDGAMPRVAWPIRLMQAWPWLQRLPARAIGLGFRPEHVHSPDLAGERPPASSPAGPPSPRG
ncbi:MAG: FAD-dependent oxidoreductase [Reyranellaceae bacterium]